MSFALKYILDKKNADYTQNYDLYKQESKQQTQCESLLAKIIYSFRSKERVDS